MNNNFSEEKASTLGELYENTIVIKKLTDEYLSKFNADGILKFFSDESDKKEYFERYRLFTVKLANALTPFENTVAKISRLVYAADRNCDKDLTAFFCELFERCEHFLAAIAKFLNSNDKNFSKNEVFKASLALSTARELKCAVDIFLNSQST